MLLCSSKDLTLEAAIEKHKVDTLYSDVYDAFRITVRRGHIFDDTLVALRSGFDEKKHLRRCFLGEKGVDGGGPRREFFMLLMGSIANYGSILDGPPERRVLRHNTTAFEVCSIHSYILLYIILFGIERVIPCCWQNDSSVSFTWWPRPSIFCPMHH